MWLIELTIDGLFIAAFLVILLLIIQDFFLLISLAKKIIIENVKGD